MSLSLRYLGLKWAGRLYVIVLEVLRFKVGG